MVCAARMRELNEERVVSSLVDLYMKDFPIVFKRFLKEIDSERLIKES